MIREIFSYLIFIQIIKIMIENEGGTKFQTKVQSSKILIK